MLEGIEKMFDDLNPMLRKLKKKSYEKNSEDFRGKYGHYFQEMTDYVEGADDKEAAAREIGAAIAEDVKKTFSSPKGKINSGIQADLNMFTIYYVFPTLLLTEHEDARLIADNICSEWGKQFKGNNIQYTDYDTLYGAFREKIFGIF